MPRGDLPGRLRAILESTTLAHLATVDKQGRPQVNPVWFLWDGEQVLISVKAETVKFRNIKRDPHVAMSFLDPEDSRHYVEIRGEVSKIELYHDLRFVNQLAQKYTGKNMDAREDGNERYKLTIRVDSWTGQ